MNTPDAQLAEMFRKDTTAHRLTVQHEDGLYRHLRWAKPGTGECAIEVTSIPGYLIVTGDMGSWTFHRHGSPDLLAEGFFTGNARYDRWASKLEAADTRVGLRDFSEETLKATVEEAIEEWSEGDAELRETLHQETYLIRSAESTEEALSSMVDFGFSGYSFDEVRESDVTEYTFQFRWICLALGQVTAGYRALLDSVEERDAA